MDRLHQQPFLTVFCYRWRFPMKPGMTDLLQRLRFFVVQFFGSSRIKGDPLAIGILDSGSVILYAIQCDRTIIWNLDTITPEK